MTNIKLKGPFRFLGEKSIFDEITQTINGVYLWCIKNDNGSFLVYYVGESVDVKSRMRSHLKKQLQGEYTGHSIERLKENVQVLMHRAGIGMIPRFSKMDRELFNKKIVDNLYVFYAQLPVKGKNDEDKWLRCRYESGIVFHVENQGQNIISVGHLRYWKGELEQVKITTDNCTIESLSDETITI